MKKIISICLTLFIIISSLLMCAAEELPTDVNGTPSTIKRESSIFDDFSFLLEESNEFKANMLVQLKIIQGTQNGLELENTLTRAQAATILVRLSEHEEEALNWGETSNFVDTNGHWSEGYVATAFKYGYIKGASETEFEPDREITAQEFGAIFLRINGFPEAEPETCYEIFTKNFILPEWKAAELLGKSPFLRADMTEMVFDSIVVLRVKQ